MTRTLTLKTKDICEALAIGRHQLRAWTNILPPYTEQQTKERSARCFEPTDLLFFALVKHLDENFGLSLHFIARFSNSLYRCIREPYSLTSQSFLFISDAGNKCIKLSPDKINNEGIIVDLQPAQVLVCQFLGLSMQQTQLRLGLVDVN